MKPQFAHVSGNASVPRSTVALRATCSSATRSSQPCQSSLPQNGHALRASRLRKKSKMCFVASPFCISAIAGGSCCYSPGRSCVVPLHIRHRQIQRPILLTRGEGRDDVGVVEARSELGLPVETSAEALVVCELRPEQLQGDAAPGARLLGEVHGAHRALAYQRLDTEARDRRTCTDRQLHQPSR